MAMPTLLRTLLAWLNQPVPAKHADQLLHVIRIMWDADNVRRQIMYYSINFYPTYLFGSHTIFLITNVLMLISQVSTFLVVRSVRRPGRILRQSDRMRIYGLVLVFNLLYMSLALAFAQSGSKPIAMIAMMISAIMMLETITQLATEKYVHFFSTTMAAFCNLICGILVGITPVTDWTTLELGYSIVFASFACIYVGMVTVSVRKLQDDLSHAHAEASVRLSDLAFATSHDGLTGLANRAELDRLLSDALQADGRRQSRIAFLLIDLDGFKQVNDTYGHAAGDAVLKATADRMRALLRDDAAPARIGGDEFAVLLTDVADGEAAVRVADRLLVEIPKTLPWGNAQLSVGASIGIAHQADIGCGATELMAAADKAMYAAKLIEGPSRVLHDPVVQATGPSGEDRAEIEAAIRTHAIMPFFQPKIDLETGRIAGFECLARWNHPTRGLLAPAAFLPLVAELGLFNDFSFAILRQVLQQIASWRAAGFDPGRVSVNLTEATLSTRSAIEDFEWLLAEHPGLSRHLAIEVTEALIVSRAVTVIRSNIERLAALGLQVGLDDFGTGSAAFRHLRLFAFDEIKVDGTFVRDLDSGPAAVAVVESFLALARGLGAAVVAEGVETEAQAATLRGMGCRYAQGYLFGGALSALEATDRLRAASGPPLVAWSA